MYIDNCITFITPFICAVLTQFLELKMLYQEIASIWGLNGSIFFGGEKYNGVEEHVTYFDFLVILVIDKIKVWKYTN